MIHIIMIPLIIFLSYFWVYKALFGNEAVKQYKRGFMPGPRSLRAYVIWYKVFVVLMWLFAIAMYVLAVTVWL